MSIQIGDSAEYKSFHKYDPFDLIFQFNTPKALLQQDIVDSVVASACEAMAEKIKPPRKEVRKISVVDVGTCSIEHPSADVYFVLDGSYSHGYEIITQN